MFNNKVALITGAGRGIGKAIALELGKKGAIIAGIDLTEEQSGGISTFLRENNIKGQGFVMDVSQPDSIENGVTEISKTLGAPAILINNAGIYRDNLLMRMNLEDWDKVMRTNLYSVYWLCKRCVRDMMKARYGRIVSVSSVVAYTGNPGQTNYTAAKAGVIAFSKSLALEVASRNITVNIVAPGFIESDMTHRLTEEQQQQILNTVPLNRPGQADDVAKAVSFLASDDASYITGVTLHVSGGMFMN